MNEETKVYDSIEEMEQEELGRLYAELEAAKPGSDQYDKILAEICKIREKFNAGNTIWITKEDLDQRTKDAEEKLVIEREKLERQHEEHLEQMEMERSKIKTQKLDTVLRTVGTILNLVVTAGMVWTTTKYNIKMGPISTRDAWTMIFKKK